MPSLDPGPAAEGPRSGLRRCVGLRRGLRRLRSGGCGKNRRGEQCYRGSRRKQGSNFHVQGILSGPGADSGRVVWVQFNGRNGNRGKMRERFNNFGPETQPFPAMAKRRGSSAAWRMPMRGVTTTRPARVPSSRSCKGDSGSSKSSPLSALRVIPSAWHSRPGPLVNSFSLLHSASVPHPFRVVSRKAWEVISGRDSAPSAPARPPAPARAAARIRLALALARNIHAEVEPINGVDIRVPCRSEQHLVPRRGAAMRVRRRIGRLPVRSQIGLSFDDAPGQPTGTASGARALCPAAAAPRAPAAPQRTRACSSLPGSSSLRR